MTYYIIKHPDNFKVCKKHLNFKMDGIRLTVDTDEDLELLREIYKNLGDLEKLKLKEVVEFLKKNPAIRNINAHVKQKMPSNNPKITVIIRTHNSENYVRGAIESVLRQTLSSNLYEILVVDDGSKDKTKKILKSYGNKIRLLEQSNLGLIAAINLGIKKAKGKYVILLDSDDTFEPTILEKMLNVFKDTNADFVYCDYYEKNIENGRIKKIYLKNNIFNSVAGGILFKKSVIEKVGGYDESLIFSEYDLLIKLMRKKCKYKYLPKPLFIYVRHSESLTADKNMVKKGFEQLFDKYGEIKGLRRY